MRVLQLIDTLRAGGAERVAVNIANELSCSIETSYLCSTREEGPLKSELYGAVVYLFLNRNRTLDLSAINKLKRFIQVNEIDIIHAHGSSFFIATVIKIQLSELKIIWHDHLGGRVNTSLKPWSVLKLCSFYFKHVICVNKDLLEWSRINLHVDALSYLPNFIVTSHQKTRLVLQGIKGKRILHLANLRPPKNHILLLKAFSDLLSEFPEWTLHLIGKDFKDKYSDELKEFILSHELEHSAFILGEQHGISNIVLQCSIGVISSTSEGMPLALLEYGQGGLAVVSSDVGQCKDVILDFGLIFESNSLMELKDALKTLMTDNRLRQRMGKEFQKHIDSNYGPKSYIDKLYSIYRMSVNCR